MKYSTFTPLPNHWLAFAAFFGVLLSITPRPVDAAERSAQSAPMDAATASITKEDLLQHIKVLSSDEFEGRAPGSKGEEKSVQYIVEQFKRFGLKPGNPDGSYLQNVPLVGLTAQPTISYRIGNRTAELAFPSDCVVATRRVLSQVDVENSEMIFVGYGIVAPEYDWDDYKGVDVRGKTIVMLVNDPPIPDPSDSTRLDEKMFKGKAMTYYGRWTYKYEIATEKGAAAAIIVHETGPAGYPYFVVVGSWGRENFDLKTPDKNAGRVAVEGWIHLDKAKELFAAGGQNFDDLKAKAARKDFKPVPLGGTATFRLKNSMREVASRNVMARLDGSNPKLRDEYVIYTAHWDHLGRNDKLEGDQIFNGAADNASGTAALLELAQAFSKLPTAPERTVLFLAVTAEEQGLLGAKYYAAHPLYPLERTLANLNIDGVNQWGRTRDLEVIGFGNSTLDDLAVRAAASQGRMVTSDSESEKGRFYRSDHFEFAKLGVPALYVKGGIDFIDKPKGFAQQKSDEYWQRDYHKVTDEIKPDWDLSGAAEDVQLLLKVGYEVAQGQKYPEWKPGTEFKTRREEMLKKARGK